MSQFQISRYTSDRLFRAMGCGAFTLVHRFPEMNKVIYGYRDFTFDAFNDIEGLKKAIHYNLDDDQMDNNADFIHNNYTYKHMVKRIIDL